MSRLWVLMLLAVAGTLCWQAPARASGDGECATHMRVSHANLYDCGNRAAILPGNDTRTNLLLLLNDQRGTTPMPAAKTGEALGTVFEWSHFSDWLTPDASGASDSDYASGEGSRCRSKDSGAAAFTAAVGAAGLAADERAPLIAARTGFKPDCVQPSGGAAALQALEARLRSPAAKGFARYLAGALAFYDGDFATAAARFAGLRDAPQPWLRETARYMAARTDVNRAQAGVFDEYGGLDHAKVDQKVIAAADQSLHAYLKDYPNGSYAISARGLLRRVYWIGARRGPLIEQYLALMRMPVAAPELADVALAEEMDNKLFAWLTPADTRDPLLLAVIDLQRMRVVDDPDTEGCCSNPLPLAELMAQRAAFAGNPALFDYLVAVHGFYVQKKPADVMRLIPDATHQARFGALQFSRQVLRGLALEAVRDRNARGFWIEMLPGARFESQRALLELAIAWHDERTRAVARVFEPDSPVREGEIRQTLITYTADAALLRQQATSKIASKAERDLALYVLLKKDLTRGAYADFVNDLALVSPTEVDGKAGLGLFTRTKALGDYECPTLKATAQALATDPRAVRANLCLSEFLRANGDVAIEVQMPAGDLGGTPTLFAGKLYSRHETYKRIIADPAAAAGDKAYALFRAVNCYAPSGNNDCGGTDVPEAQRKAWYDRLKADYPTSRWAKALRFYW